MQPNPYNIRPRKQHQRSALACCSCALLMFSFSSSVAAGILAQSTRVIYYQHEHEKSLILANTNAYPILNQVWVDDGSNQIEYADAAFVVLPAVFKMAPQEVKALRILYNGLSLAPDRESVYWLNLYEIPALKTDPLASNQLHMAMNTQLKIFYRPTALKPMSITAIANNLKFQDIKTSVQDQVSTAAIRVSNPSPYHVTLLSLSLSNSSQAIQLIYPNQMNNMIAPFSHREFIRPQTAFDPQSPLMLRYTLIDDEGKSQNFEKKWSSINEIERKP